MRDSLRCSRLHRLVADCGDEVDCSAEQSALDVQIDTARIHTEIENWMHQCQQRPQKVSLVGHCGQSALRRVGDGQHWLHQSGEERIGDPLILSLEQITGESTPQNRTGRATHRCEALLGRNLANVVEVRL